MNLHLVDGNATLVEGWRDAFSSWPDIEVECTDILRVAHTCIVSPANSYGFMDGGIDYQYYQFFGPQIQTKVQDAIARRPEGHLPVGAGLVVSTGHSRIRYLLVAPTMNLPGAVSPKHCYYAMLAVLQTADRWAQQISDVFCPGLATGVGRVPESVAAAEMAAAYRDWIARRETA